MVRSRVQEVVRSRGEKGFGAREEEVCRSKGRRGGSEKEERR